VTTAPPTETARRPRVMHVITHLDMGGAETVALGLIDALRDRIDFSLFAVLRQAAAGAIGRDMAGRLDRWRVPYRFGVGGRFKSGGVIVAARALARAIAEQRPDVVHVHTEIPEMTLAVACLLSRRTRRTPLLRTVHNCELWIAWGGLGRWVTQRLAHGDAVAVSRHAAKADAAIETRTPRAPAAVLYNGVARPARVPSERNGPVRVLFAGRLVHQKGADLLPAILSSAHARTARRDVAVVIAGSGVLHDAVEQGLARLDGWSVRLTPPIERLSERLADHDVVLAPSRFEGFGLLPAEVLLAGLPVVTTNAPGLDEVIPADYPFRAKVDDVTALGAHLAAVIDDPAGARQIAARYGDDLARQFDPEAMASAYLARYRALGRHMGGAG
jgi:glycosyltransferase involved in cell wall biosynthesis